MPEIILLNLQLTINKENVYIGENNRNKYLALVFTDESRSKLKSMKNFGAKLKSLSDNEIITEMIMIKNI